MLRCEYPHPSHLSTCRSLPPLLLTAGPALAVQSIVYDLCCCRHQVSKSALFAVGAPHTWPGLLAALAWLVEMLSYEEKAAAARASSFDDRARCSCYHGR